MKQNKIFLIIRSYYALFEEEQYISILKTFRKNDSAVSYIKKLTVSNYKDEWYSVGINHWKRDSDDKHIYIKVMEIEN